MGVCWYEARAYGRWLSQHSGQQFRLPSEAEWEAAARGVAGCDYPWGKHFAAEHANTDEAHLRRTSPVGVYPQGATPGAAAVYDLAGNAWEWTSSLYQDYPITRDDGREDSDATEARVLRGGAWDLSASLARAACRLCDSPLSLDYRLGFRVLCSPPSPGTDH